MFKIECVTLDQKIKLIDELIRENPEATIREYWQTIYGEQDKILTMLVFESAMNKVEEKQIRVNKNDKYYKTYHLNL